MDLVQKLARHCKKKLASHMNKTIEKIQEIKHNPLTFLMLNCFSSLEMAGKYFLSPFQTGDFRNLENVRLAPAEGAHLHVAETISVLILFRVLLQLALGFSGRFAIALGGFLTIDGVIFLLVSFVQLMGIFSFWVLQTKRKELSWVFNQSIQLPKNCFGNRYPDGKTVLSITGRDPSMLFFLSFINQVKFGGPVFIAAVVVVNRHSPIFLPSYPFLEDWIGYNFASMALLTADVFVLEVLLCYFMVAGTISVVPFFVTVFCIRSLRSAALKRLYWRKRRQLHVQLEVLSNFFTEISAGYVPVAIASFTLVSVAFLVLAIKLSGMKTEPISVLLAATLLSFNNIMVTFFTLRMTESVATESMGLMDELRLEAAADLRNNRLAILLTRRRLIRQSCGHFMFMGSGMALAFLMAVLDNTVSGMFMVTTAAQSYFFSC